jgi:TRAP-type C4-dicarboxylate transport system permease small subunit
LDRISYSRRTLELLGRVLIIVFLLAVAWYGFEFMRRTSEQEAVALEISLGWIHASIPVGCVLLAVHVIFTDLFRSAVSQDKDQHVL